LASTLRDNLAMSNSPAEFVFKARYEKQTGHRLVHGNQREPDWIDTQTKAAFEIKQINYPRTHFKDQIRVNAMSISRHAQENPNAKVVLVFTDNVMLTSEPRTIAENSQVEPSQQTGDRLTYLTPLSIFEPF